MTSRVDKRLDDIAFNKTLDGDDVIGELEEPSGKKGGLDVESGQ